MPVSITYTCDMCKEEIEWTVYKTNTITIKSPSAVHAMYEVPRPDPTYCSIECLGKSLQWWANKYDKEHPNE